MEFKDRIEQAKQDFIKLFAKFEDQETQGVLLEGTLSDGTVIKYDKLEVGGKVSVVTEQGEVKAPEGPHELTDGTIVTVDPDGIITAIEPKKEELAEIKTPEEMKAVASKFATGSPEDRIANLELLCKALMEAVFGWEIRQSEQKAIVEEAIANYKLNFAAQFKDQATVQKTIIELMEALSEEGAVPPVQAPKGAVTEKAAKKASAKEAFISAVQNLNKEDK